MQNIAPTAVDALTLDLFLPLVGTAFAVDIAEPEPMPLVLEAASPLTPHALRADPFVLHFTGPGPDYLQQRIHRFSHPAIGAFEIFLVPTGRHGDGFAYESVFN